MIQNNSDSTLYISLDAIRYNYAYFKSLSKTAETACVVKANCYGLGAKIIAPIFEEQGCKTFFVATLSEAIDLRSFMKKSSEIFVLHGVKPNELEFFHSFNLQPVINDIFQLEIYSKYCASVDKKLGCIIHFDTGMNRLGIDFQKAEAVKNSGYLNSINVKYLMSHFACVSEIANPLTQQQHQRCLKIKEIFPDIKFSLCNSRGAISNRNYHFDLLRPGSGLYGICGGVQKEISHVITVKAKIIQLRKLPEDASVGYGATHKAKKGARLAIVPVGYADGYLRSLSNNSYAYFKGYKLPLLGIVSMDLVTFDISNVPEHLIKLGDEVELAGENVWVNDISNRANTIGYEFLTRLGSRFKRVYF